ncbi:nucleotidyltransferase domain-containing protein [Methanothermococcus sp. SCGC AD-155-M21]|nr:nucleotidyltransferase domain-containing protein [Methanothermococcus sp. SCGC AD-155-M21]
MKVRLRDFIETEIGFFAVNTYDHPKDKIFAFLRYLYLDNSNKDIIKKYRLDIKDIRQLNGKKYIKITDTKKTYDILKDYFPDYLYYDDTKDILLHAIPKDRIINILTPKDRLEEILIDSKNKFEEKCKYLANIFHEEGIDYKYMGISGSTVIKLNNENSDIDFVIYSMENHKLAREILKSIFNGEEENYKKKYKKIIHPLSEEFWKKAYNKRIKDNTISYNDFIFHERRKYNRGLIYNTMFDILATRDWREINSKYGEITYKGIGTIEIQCRVINDRYIFDNPAIYGVEDIEIIDTSLIENNYHLEPSSIKEVVSYTHTYAGQAFNGEKIIVRGKLERVISSKGEHMRVLVGTSREAFNEYILLIN